jgi:hypothetical protein
MTTLVERIKKIILQPQQEWPFIGEETTTTSALYKSYIIPLAAIGPAASLIGMSIIGIGMPFAGRFRVPIGTAILSTIVHYILSLIGVYVLALVTDYLAPFFSGEKNMGQSLKLSAYSLTAAWIAGVFAIIPALSILSVTGLYSLYLLYLGIPILMKTPREKSLGYTIALFVVTVVIFWAISLILQVLYYPAIMPR